MVIHIANPIYDSVFKYLMEDDRVARTLLSALLRVNIVKVEVRRHEYSNGSRNNISMFRIDFGATVRDEDGTERLILIELQKTWLETETLRFRQYLGAQYANPENMRKDGKFRSTAIPMVTVYILGHKVGDIEEPVLYVNHESYDYNGNRVTKGLPDPFVDSLVHDSIIVQIPRLSGKIHNRLDKVLVIFDQSKAAHSDRHLIDIDESLYEDDEEMQYVLRRLLKAAVDSQLRMDMNVEDEFFTAIEDRDTAIMQRDKRIKEQQTKLSEQQTKLSEQQTKLSEQDALLRSMVETLLKNGMSVDTIAQSTGKTVAEIQKLI